MTAVIPNWNRRQLLERLLDALNAGTRRPDEILVVDNGSTDGSLEAAQSRGARVIALERNHGFAYAVNRGVEAASGSWIAIVNNDVVPSRDWLERITAHDAAFACGKLLDEADPEKVDGTFDLVSVSGLALRAGHRRPAQEALWNHPRPVQLAPLTAAVFRREVFAKVGLLDERFVSYLEDVDFGLRCGAAGITGLYLPQAVATHKGSATLGAWSAASTRLLSRNQVLLVSKHLPPKIGTRRAARVILGQLLWGLAAARRGQGRAWLAGKIEGRRESGQRCGSEQTALLLERCEAELLAVERQAPAGWLWRLYRWMA